MQHKLWSKFHKKVSANFSTHSILKFSSNFIYVFVLLNYLHRTAFDRNKKHDAKSIFSKFAYVFHCITFDFHIRRQVSVFRSFCFIFQREKRKVSKLVSHVSKPLLLGASTLKCQHVR